MQNYNLKRKTNKTFDLKRRAYIYALDIIEFLESLLKDYISQIIGKQLLRSATSIGANIIEAQAASSKKDFVNFFSIALKSANENKFWLGLLRDSKKGDIKKINDLIREADELARIIGAIILTSFSLLGKR